MGLDKSRYNVTIEAPVMTETLDGTEQTDYIIQINSTNVTKGFKEYGFNKSNFMASDYGRLFAAGDIHAAAIRVSEFKVSQGEATSENLVDTLKLFDGDNPQIVDLRVVPRKIDGVDGAIASERIVFDPNNPMLSVEAYHILYSSAFDPSHVAVEIQSIYPWDEGTRQLLKTIHVERSNKIP